MTREEMMEMTAEEIFRSRKYQGYEYGLELFLEVEGEDFTSTVYISNEDIKNYFNLPYAGNEDITKLYWQNEDEIDFYFIKSQLDRIKAEIQRKLKEKEYIKDFALRLKERK